MAIEEKAAVILNLETQLFNDRSTLAGIQVSLHHAEGASVITCDDNQPDEDNDEAMAPSNHSCSPSKGIS